jgi:lipopolysaccharide export system protein LptA
MSAAKLALLLLVLVPLVVPLPAEAASSPPIPADRPAAADSASGDGSTGDVPTKVTITGDNFEVEDNKHQATFTGNVVVVQPDVTVHADTVVALYGEGGASNISQFQATGHVILITPDQTATGELAVFDPKTHMLTLTGNVVVTNKAGQVQSTRLVVNLRNKKSVFTTAGGRVTGVFNSE